MKLRNLYSGLPLKLNFRVSDRAIERDTFIRIH